MIFCEMRETYLVNKMSDYNILSKAVALFTYLHIKLNVIKHLNFVQTVVQIFFVQTVVLTTADVNRYFYFLN